jgi:radical SAM superfamily enzyme YgiQ (UPF0313 family)
MFCLIRPPGVETFRIGTLTLTPPLGAAYIAAAVEASGRVVRVIDAVTAAPQTHTAYFSGYLVGLRVEDIVRRIPAETQAVGISCIFTHEWPMVARLVELIRRARPDLPIIVGGEHATSLPEFCLATSEANVIVLGEGEETVVALLDALENGDGLESIAGIAYRSGSDIKINSRRARATDLDAIATPAWHHFELETYHENRFVGGMYSSSVTVPMLATRGCPYQCTYCSAPNMWTPRWIPRDPVKVVDEIESYVTELGAGNFPFQDLTAIIKKEWIVAFCREILRRGLDITWQMPSGTRSEAIDAEVAELQQTGMISMAYAPESGSESTRRLIKKRMGSERLFESVRAAADAGLNVMAYVVIGFPHDGPDDLAQNIPFAKKLARAGVKDLGTGYYMALPGTQLFSSLCLQGRIVFNRDYFRHILEGLAVVPARSYCERIGRLGLFSWKLRLSFAFYGARLRDVGVWTALRNARQAMGAESHGSKLQTALRVALKNGLASLAVKLQPGWMSKRDERRMFAEWESIFRELWDQRLAAGLEETTSVDMTRLHEENVIHAIRTEHESGRVVRASHLQRGGHTRLREASG